MTKSHRDAAVALRYSACMTDTSLTTSADWHPAPPADELEPGSMTVWKHAGQPLVLVRTEDGEVHALDNRCPHEGYPLSSGDLKGCALTCCWHNWKFDVRDGSCTLGEEGVRSFPTRVRDGRVEVDLAEPDPRESWPGLLESFDEGMREHQVARCARDGVRLLQAGYDAHALLLRVALYDARHAEYGSTHALAAAADCGRLLERYTGMEAMFAIAPALDMCGRANHRLPARPRPAAMPGADSDALRAAVVAEELERAGGLLRGAFETGTPRAEIEGWLYAALSDHFLDFGHELIYLVKAQELFERAGDEHADEILGGLLHAIVLGTREDTLPYMRGYARRFEEHLAARAGGLAELWERSGSLATALDPAPLRDAVLDGSLDEAFDALVAALEAGAAAVDVARALVGAAAQRLYRFDVAIDADPAVAETWLWATHRLTFASAVRNAVERFDSPDALRFLLQAVAFVHSGAPMDAPPERRHQPAARSIGVAEVVGAIAGRDLATAVDGTLGLLDDVEGLALLRRTLEDLALSDPLVRPIAVVHVIKTLLAAFEEFDGMAEHPDRAWPLLAVVRFLASPVVERRVNEAVARSIRWVAEGEMPRKLTQ